MFKFLKKQPPARIIAVGFLLMILLGSLLLSLPCSVRPGVRLPYLDALYTATSAVCVTGLAVVDAHDTFTPLGEFILGCLIQIGGLGVASIGTGIALMVGGRLDLKGQTLIRETLNLDSGKGLIRFLRSVFFMTVTIELAGALLSFPVFLKRYPPLRAAGISLFHSVASFNNSGFDILGGMRNLIPYQTDVPLNLITCALVILGGIGFPVLRELWAKRFRLRRLSMHAKIVLSVNAVLLAAGTLLLVLTENISWLGAFFFSVSARTAGFSTYPLAAFTQPGLLVIIVLMFIGASPGSTGGGIKTTTFFVLLQGIRSAATNRGERAFRYSIPADAFRKAAVIAAIGLGVVTTGTYLMAVFEPRLPLMDILFEVVSAFGTVGLSTGITPELSFASRLLSIVLMYIGRLGPMTIATVWHFTNGDRIRYPEGNIAIG